MKGRGMPPTIFVFRLLIVILGLVSPSYLGAMTFERSGNGGNCFVGCEYIVLDGEIGPSTGQDFAAYLDSIAPWSPKLVYINSLGGSLFGGLELGRVFRSRGLAVYVGKVVDNEAGEVTEAGLCYSACAYALLGGLQRGNFDYVTNVGNPLSQIGFHQFYSLNQGIENQVKLLGEELKFSEEQIVSGLIASYLAEMEVDARVLLLASSTSGNEIYVPDLNEMNDLGITRDITAPFSEFEVEIYGNDVFLFSKRQFDDGWNQLSQITFFCRNGGIAMLTTGENSAASGTSFNLDRKFNASTDFPSFLSVTVDGEQFQASAEQISERFSTDGRLHYATVPLDESFVSAVESAHLINISYEIARAAGNYQARITVDQTAKFGLSYLRKMCRHS